MGEMNSNADLFHSKTTPNLCGPPWWRTQVWSGDPSLWWSDRGAPHSACTQADPDKGLAEVPSHIHSDDVSLPSVVGIYQVAECDSEGDSWTRGMADESTQGILRTSSPLERINLFPSSILSRRGGDPTQGRREDPFIEHLLDAHSVLGSFRLISWRAQSSFSS